MSIDNVEAVSYFDKKHMHCHSMNGHDKDRKIIPWNWDDVKEDIRDSITSGRECGIKEKTLTQTIRDWLSSVSMNCFSISKTAHLVLKHPESKDLDYES